MEIDNSAFPSSRILIDQFKRKLTESCLKDLVSQCCHKLIIIKKSFARCPRLDTLHCKLMVDVIKIIF